MKSLASVLLMIAILGISLSCKKATTTPSDPNPVIPDTYFEIEVSGDQSKSFNITIPASTPQTTFSITGSQSQASNLLLLSAREIPNGWGIGLNVTCADLATGNFLSNQGSGDISAYSSTGATSFVYLSTSATVELTKVDLFSEVQNIKNYYVDGTFTATLADPNDASKVVNVSGKFRGVYVPST